MHDSIRYGLIEVKSLLPKYPMKEDGRAGLIYRFGQSAGALTDAVLSLAHRSANSIHRVLDSTSRVLWRSMLKKNHSCSSPHLPLISCSIELDKVIVTLYFHRVQYDDAGEIEVVFASTPTEQPPRKLSGKRTAMSGTIWREAP